MYEEFSCITDLGGVDLVSTVRLNRGNFYLFPFGPRTEFHSAIHSGVFEAASRANTFDDVQRLFRESIPKKIHVGLRRHIHLPHSYSELPLGEPEWLGLWNDDWDENEFLLLENARVPNGLLVQREGTQSFRVDLGEVLRHVFHSLRVVGGREVALAKPAQAIRKGCVFHPFVGAAFFPLVFRYHDQRPPLPVTDQENEIMAHDFAGLGLERLETDRLQQIISDAMSENHEVLRYLLTVTGNHMRGIHLPPPQPLPIIA